MAAGDAPDWDKLHDRASQLPSMISQYVRSSSDPNQAMSTVILGAQVIALAADIQAAVAEDLIDGGPPTSTEGNRESSD